MSGQNEFAVIADYFTQGYPVPKNLSVGIGDDASVVNLNACQLVQSIDTQVENIHFLAQAPASLIAQRALRCATSDLAAMGAVPHSFHLALSLPKYARATHWLASFAQGLKQAAYELGVGLIGGDTTSSNELAISIMVQGTLPLDESAITRSKAQVGDDLWLSGKVGLAHKALNEELIQVDESNLPPNVCAYYRPEVHIHLGQKLLNYASACIDVSDGLIQDATHLAQSSGVSLILDGKLLIDWLSLSEVDFWPALTGGDDYQLLFSANRNHRSYLDQLKCQFPELTRIGQVLSEQSERVFVKDALGQQPDQIGFQHF